MSETAIAERHETTDIAVAEPRVTDAAQARVDSVARVIDAAYQRASMLELTDAESKALLAPFPDSAIQPGAKGKENLLYVEHASIRGRMFEVFGPGRWSLIPRRMWTEEAGTAVRVYADCVLIVRGCYVGEAIGAGNYHRNNVQMDYSDAAEAAQSEALRRIGGKYLGIGLQLWNKAYTDEWKQRRKGIKPAESYPDEPTPAPHAVSDSYKEGYQAGKKAPSPQAEPKAQPKPDAKIMAEWEQWLASDPNCADVNAKLPEMSAESGMDPWTRAAIWQRIKAGADAAGWTFSPAAHGFVPPNNATFGESAPLGEPATA